jgi:hypothetical protein
MILPIWWNLVIGIILAATWDIDHDDSYYDYILSRLIMDCLLFPMICCSGIFSVCLKFEKEEAKMASMLPAFLWVLGSAINLWLLEGSNPNYTMIFYEKFWTELYLPDDEWQNVLADVSVRIDAAFWWFGLFLICAVSSCSILAANLYK